MKTATAPLGPAAQRKLDQKNARALAAKKAAKKKPAAKKAAKPAVKAAKKTAAKTVTAPATKRARAPMVLDLKSRIAIGRTAVHEAIQATRAKMGAPRAAKAPDAAPVLGRPERINWDAFGKRDWQALTNKEIADIAGCSIPNAFLKRKKLNEMDRDNGGPGTTYDCKRGKYARNIKLEDKALAAAKA